MDLDPWLADQPLGTSRKLAAAVNTTPTTISLIRKKKRRSSFGQAIKISAFTGGAVSIQELLGIEEIPTCVRLRADDPTREAA